MRAFPDRGLPKTAIAKLVCPMGVAAICDKRPPIIAALVAAEFLAALLGTDL